MAVPSGAELFPLLRYLRLRLAEPDKYLFTINMTLTLLGLICLTGWQTRDDFIVPLNRTCERSIK